MTASDKPLSGRVLYFCTPLARGQQVHWSYLTSFLYASRELETLGAKVLLEGPTMAPILKGRNEGMTHFLEESSATDLIFIDDDMAYMTEAILGLLNCTEDFISGAYPRRVTDWDLLWARIRNGQITSAEDLATLSAPLLVTLDWKPGEQPEVKQGRYTPALEVGAGFLRMTRHAVLQMAAKSKRYRQKVVGGGTEVHYMFCEQEYDIPSAGPDAVDDVGVLYSEDYSLCRKWRKQCGGRIWVDMLSRFEHTGPATFASMSIGEILAKGQVKK